MLKICGNSICNSICSSCITSGKFPSEWKEVKIVPIPKNEDKITTKKITANLIALYLQEII